MGFTNIKQYPQKQEKPPQSYWDAKEERTQKSIMIGQAYNLASEEITGPQNDYTKEEIKQRTRWHYQNLKELHEEI